MDRKNNYIMVSLTVVYLIIAVIQFNIDGLLPAWLYISISFVSLNISCCEVLKSACTYIVKILKKQILCETLDEFGNKNMYDKNKKRMCMYEKLLCKVEFFEIFFCIIILFITPLKAITYSAITNKITSVLSLVSFSLIFLSFYINNLGSIIDNNDKTDLYYKNS